MNFISSEELKKYVKNIHDIWRNLTEPGKFKGFSSENFREIVTDLECSPHDKWAEYIKIRYGYY